MSYYLLQPSSQKGFMSHVLNHTNGKKNLLKQGACTTLHFLKFQVCSEVRGMRNEWYSFIHSMTTLLTSLFLLRELRGSEVRTEFSWNSRLRSCLSVTERSSKTEFAFPTMYTLWKKNPKLYYILQINSNIPKSISIFHKIRFKFSLNNESWFFKAFKIKTITTYFLTGSQLQNHRSFFRK